MHTVMIKIGDSFCTECRDEGIAEHARLEYKHDPDIIIDEDNVVEDSYDPNIFYVRAWVRVDVTPPEPYYPERE